MNIENISTLFKQLPEGINTTLSKKDSQGHFKIPLGTHIDGNGNTQWTSQWKNVANMKRPDLTLEHFINAKGAKGISIVLNQNSLNLVCLDLDGYKDKYNGDKEALDVCEYYFNKFKDKTYCELSASGQGKHILFWSDYMPSAKCLHNIEAIENFNRISQPNARALAITGNVISSTTKIATIDKKWDDYNIEEDLLSPSKQLPSLEKDTLWESKDIDYAFKFLMLINPDCGYDRWVEIMMAWKSEYGCGGFKYCMEWCKSRGNIQKTTTPEKKWQEIKQGGNKKIGTMYYYASLESPSAYESLKIKSAPKKIIAESLASKQSIEKPFFPDLSEYLPFNKRMAESLQCSESITAITALSMLGCALSGVSHLEDPLNGTTTPMVLFAWIGLPSGGGKSRIVKPFRTIYEDFAKKYTKHYADQLNTYKLIELENSNRKSKYYKEKANKDKLIEKPEMLDQGIVPVCPSTYSTGGTIEGLTKKLGNGGMCNLVTTELKTIITEQVAITPNKIFQYLCCFFSGETIVIDRAATEELRIESPVVSFTAFDQTADLIKFVKTNQAYIENGLGNRVLLEIKDDQLKDYPRFPKGHFKPKSDKDFLDYCRKTKDILEIYTYKEEDPLTPGLFSGYIRRKKRHSILFSEEISNLHEEMAYNFIDMEEGDKYFNYLDSQGTRAAEITLRIAGILNFLKNGVKELKDPQIWEDAKKVVLYYLDLLLVFDNEGIDELSSEKTKMHKAIFIFAKKSKKTIYRQSLRRSPPIKSLAVSTVERRRRANPYDSEISENNIIDEALASHPDLKFIRNDKSKGLLYELKKVK